MSMSGNIEEISWYFHLGNCQGIWSFFKLPKIFLCQETFPVWPRLFGLGYPLMGSGITETLWFDAGIPVNCLRSERHWIFMRNWLWNFQWITCLLNCFKVHSTNFMGHVIKSSMLREDGWKYWTDTVCYETSGCDLAV